MSEVDWEKCMEDLKEKFPAIKDDLDKMLDGFFDTNIKHSAILENFPPRIEVIVRAEGYLQIDEFMKKLGDLGGIFYYLGDFHELRCYTRKEGPLIAYNLKPYYEKYEFEISKEKK